MDILERAEELEESSWQRETFKGLQLPLLVTKPYAAKRKASKPVAVGTLKVFHFTVSALTCMLSARQLQGQTAAQLWAEQGPLSHCRRCSLILRQISDLPIDKRELC